VVWEAIERIGTGNRMAAPLVLVEGTAMAERASTMIGVEMPPEEDRGAAAVESINHGGKATRKAAGGAAIRMQVGTAVGRRRRVALGVG